MLSASHAPSTCAMQRRSEAEGGPASFGFFCVLEDACANPCWASCRSPGPPCYAPLAMHMQAALKLQECWGRCIMAGQWQTSLRSTGARPRQTLQLADRSLCSVETPDWFVLFCLLCDRQGARPFLLPVNRKSPLK